MWQFAAVLRLSDKYLIYDFNAGVQGTVHVNGFQPIAEVIYFEWIDFREVLLVSANPNFMDLRKYL